MKLLFGICLSILCSMPLTAQFSGAVTMGFSTNQINGDGIAGYNKLGWTGGIMIFYPIKETIDIGLEFLYTQRGSAPSISVSKTINDEFSVHLEYLEIPIIARYKDWYVEDENFYKAFLEGGLSLGYLFKADTDNIYFEGSVEDFNQYDLSYIFGLGFNFTNKWSLGLRYTRSLFPIYSEQVFHQVSAIAYNWNVKVYYHL